MTESTPGNSTTDLLQSLSSDLTALVRQELRRAQEELAAKGRQAGKAAALLSGAGILGVLAVGGSSALLLRLLERRLSPTTAALVATALYGSAAGVLGATAVREFRRAWPLVPEETVATIRSDVRVVTAPGGTGAAPRP